MILLLSAPSTTDVSTASTYVPATYVSTTTYEPIPRSAHAAPIPRSTHVELPTTSAAKLWRWTCYGTDVPATDERATASEILGSKGLGWKNYRFHVYLFLI